MTLAIFFKKKKEEPYEINIFMYYYIEILYFCIISFYLEIFHY